MDTRTAEILTQVAFKLAGDAAISRSVADTHTPETFVAEVAAFYEPLANLLFDLVEQESKVRAAFPTSPVVTDSNVVQFPQQQATVSAPAATVSIKGTAYGPIPDWLVREAAAAGVTEVWDNRGKISAGEYKSTAPHFKQVVPKGTDPSKAKPFFPPKG